MDRVRNSIQGPSVNPEEANDFLRLLQDDLRQGRGMVAAVRLGEHADRLIVEAHAACNDAWLLSGLWGQTAGMSVDFFRKEISITYARSGRLGIHAIPVAGFPSTNYPSSVLDSPEIMSIIRREIPPPTFGELIRRYR